MCKFHPRTDHEGQAGVEVKLYSFLTSALYGGGGSTSRPDRFTPGKEIWFPLYIVQGMVTYVCVCVLKCYNWLGTW